MGWVDTKMCTPGNGGVEALKAAVRYGRVFSCKPGDRSNRAFPKQTLNWLALIGMLSVVRRKNGSLVGRITDLGRDYLEVARAAYDHWVSQ